MIRNILLAGVGGQGTILMSDILSEGLIELGHDVKMSEIHGMAQRGGSVVTQIRFGEKVYSPLISEGEADVIVAFEKAEALRALPYLKAGGTLLTDECEIYPVSVLMGASSYPHDALEKISSAGVRVHIVRATQTAASLGNVRAQNICLLGALVGILKLEKADWEALISRFVPEKARPVNLKAFRAGYDLMASRQPRPDVLS